MFQTLVKRFGIEKTHKLMQLYRSNWITETDYRNVKELGMNVIRLPVWYRNFQSDDNGTWYSNPVKVDEIISPEVVAVAEKEAVQIGENVTITATATGTSGLKMSPAGEGNVTTAMSR